MPQFVTGVVSAWLVVAIWFILRDSKLPVIGIKRLTFKTKHGQNVYDMGVPKHTGYTLTRFDIELAEDFFIDQCWKEFGAEKIREYFSNNIIEFTFYPIPDRASKTGYSCATYKNNIIRLGLQPWVHKTALVHEWMHDMLREKFRDSDSGHTKEKFWEGGLVGTVNNKLEINHLRAT